MRYMPIPADACNPALPGCLPESSSEPLATGLLIAVFAGLLVLAGIVVLVAFLLYRGRRSPETPGDAGLPPASWQPDPNGEAEWRWWDGEKWTDKVSGGDAAGSDP